MVFILIYDCFVIGVVIHLLLQWVGEDVMKRHSGQGSVEGALAAWL